MFNSSNAKEHGRRGGLETLKRHGRQHYARIGRKGYEKVIQEHFGGNEDEYKAYLAQLARHNYWMQTGLPGRYDRDGRMIYNQPHHPAHKIPF